MGIIPLSYFQKKDTLWIARDLLGKYLFSRIEGVVTGGMIIETEAYMGTEDKACHAYKGCRTKRTEVMYESGGVAYLYLCYGMHTLFNIVTHERDEPHAVLIRALRPTVGLEEMQKRRGKRNLTAGPGMVSKALGLTLSLSGEPLTGEILWVEEKEPFAGSIVATPRIGIDYAEEYAEKPWRFSMQYKQER